MSCGEGVCRLARPGRAALAGSEGFPEEVLAGHLPVPLRELGEPPQHRPLFLQLALVLRVRRGCLTPHTHAVQQACQHRQDGVLADCTPFLRAESRESEGWKACPPWPSAFRARKRPPRGPFSFPCCISEPTLFPLAEPRWSSGICSCRGRCYLPPLSSSASWTFTCRVRAGKELLTSKLELP